MKNPLLSLHRLALVAGATLALGACNRAQYATLPRADAYLNTPTAVAKPQPAALAATPAPVLAQAEAPAPAQASTVATQPATVPAESAPASAATVTRPAEAPALAASPAPARKLNFAQRLVLKKITKKLDKIVAKAPQLKQQDATAARGGLDQNLRYAIIFGAIGLVLLLLTGQGTVFGVLGGISLIIGLVFLLLWVLDQA